METPDSSSMTRANDGVTKVRSKLSLIRFLQQVQPRMVLGAMMFMQLLWLVAIWTTGASSNWRKIVILGVYSIVVGLTVFYLPASWLSKVRALRIRLEEDPKRFFFFLLILVLILGVIYAKYQRGWTWDEDNMLVAATIISEDGIGTFFQNYTQIPWLGNQHPPLIPLINGLVMGVLARICSPSGW